MFERKTILFPGDFTCPFRGPVYGCLCGGDGGGGGGDVGVKKNKK